MSASNNLNVFILGLYAVYDTLLAKHTAVLQCSSFLRSECVSSLQKPFVASALQKPLVQRRARSKNADNN